MTSGMLMTIVSVLLLICVFLWGPRPRLDPQHRSARLPKGTPTELSQWLAAQEHKAQVTDGTEAHIVFADASKPAPTRWVFLYLHGFSATWPETAPLTQTLANHYQANVFQSRLSGHGLGTEGMHASAEDWLESVATQFHIASRLGDQIIIVATSTGAALSVWLAQHYPERIDAILHLSPNYRVRNPLGQILTWPWSPLWVPWIVGSYREWEPISEEQRRFWSTRQPVSALIEMQKVVDWVQQQDLSKIQVPLATMYMINDPTIAPNAAVKAHRQWGADYKQLIKVVPDGNEASHVFVGDICGPSRNEWCTEQFRLFLDPLRASPT